MGRKKQNLILIVSLLLVVGFLLTSLISFFVSRASLRQQITDNSLPLTSDTVYSEIQRDLMKPIFISSLMARNTFLRDWVLNGEQPPAEIRHYLKEIQQRYHTVTSFFVSEKSRKYYYPKGILKQVSNENERDRWYFRVRQMKEDYEINIDADLANQDTMTIFINYRVFDYSGNFIGATGVGLTVNAVTSMLDNYQKKYGRNIYFIDKNGQLTLHGRNFTEGITSLADLPAIAPLAKRILQQKNGSFSVEYQNSMIHLNTRFIPEFNWYLLVEQNEATAVEGIFSSLMLNLLICAVLTLIILFLTNLTIKKYQSKIDTLRGIVPICAYCKKIRDDQGYWNQVESYVEKYTDAEFSHAYCPDCIDIHFPEHADAINHRQD